MSTTATRSVGESLERLDARAKVTGQAKYAYEYAPGELSYGLIVQSSIARGTVRSVDASRALSLPDVRTVLWAGNAPALAEGATGELAVLQSPEVAYRGQIVAIVVADSLETAQQAAQLLAIEDDEDAHDVQLRVDHPGLYKPDKVNPTYETDTERGDFDDAYATAPVTVDQTYATPAEHNNPIEPHATIAVWEGEGVTVYDSNRGSSMAGQTIARAFGLSDDQVHVISHRLVRLDVPTPSWMRAPGECPGMFALESAMDELACACGIDPVQLRILNEPDVDPENGLEWSSRGLVRCLREGAEHFGWSERDPTPGARRQGRWLYGTGVASSTYPARRRPSQAIARAEPGGRFTVMIAASDIGTGARTALTQIAADALDVAPADVTVQIGDSQLPFAMLAGGSMGTTSWGTAVLGACRRLRELLATDGGSEARYDTADDIEAEESLSRHAFSAQFAEVRVNVDSAEVQIARALGAFATGQIINPRTARSQFIGGMTMGIGMALHEESILDLEFGDYLNHDFAGYHIPACADIEGVEAISVPEDDPRINPLGAKGIGEIGIVGTAAAVASAVHHATGVRLRELPIVPAKLVGRL